MRLLLDESVPAKLRRHLKRHEVRTAVETGRAGVKNGRLLALAGEQLDVFITVDKNMPFQQNLAALPIAPVVLDAFFNELEALPPLIPELERVVSAIPYGVPMSMLRRRLVALAAAAPMGLRAAGAADDRYPSRPLTLVVPFSAGSSADSVARLMAARLAAHFRQPVVVDNRAGAGGSVGTAEVARARPDGHTLLFTTSSPLVVYPLLDKAVPYDVERDLAPVSLVTYAPLLLVARPDFPAGSLRELIELVRKYPGRYSYASSGNGSYSHMAMERLKQAAELYMVHTPYQGPALAEADLLAGNVALMFDSTVTGMALVRSGRLKSFGVSSAAAYPLAPGQAPIAQQGIAALKDFDVIGWLGLLAPRDTPRPALAALGAAMRDLLADPAVRAELAQRSTVPFAAAGADDMARLIRSDRARWQAVIRSAGIKLD